jgi:hypothetical protein
LVVLGLTRLEGALQLRVIARETLEGAVEAVEELADGLLLLKRGSMGSGEERVNGGGGDVVGRELGTIRNMETKVRDAMTTTSLKL